MLRSGSVTHASVLGVFSICYFGVLSIKCSARSSVLVSELRSPLNRDAQPLQYRWTKSSRVQGPSNGVPNHMQLEFDVCGSSVDVRNSPDVETERYGSPTVWADKQSGEEDGVVEFHKLGPSARRLTSAPGGCSHRWCCLPPEHHNHAKPGPQQKPRR
ncbi:hypothetical protein HPB52_013236 [Rhipicephalus sanguineus]|uniref:Uncharacterized protein n=1 Tax=Rhipicephalus sanguineus TaxID=34632 RepID=A0A9D4PZU9_RHISA|nr:hypothetical protein HPB52_013236 [Rhipicephalus sanguineus]